MRPGMAMREGSASVGPSPSRLPLSNRTGGGARSPTPRGPRAARLLGNDFAELDAGDVSQVEQALDFGSKRHQVLLEVVARARMRASAERSPRNTGHLGR